jgi:rhamnulose-1-phosphate aldolase
VQRAPRESLLLVHVLETLDGVRVLWPDGSELRPTSELAAHLHVHARMRARNQPFRALLHTHPTQLIALSHAPGIGRSPDRISRILWSMVPEVKVLLPEGAAVVPYALPGGEALATATADALVERRLVLWEKHGCVAIERSVTEAFDLVDTLEKAAGVYLLCRAAGYEPEGLDPDALDGLAALASDDRTEP